MHNKYLVQGAGISGLTLARVLKDKGNFVDINEKESHLGGMAYDTKTSNYFVSMSGPRIMHFRDSTKEALNFILKCTKKSDYEHQVVCIGNGTFTFWPPSKQYIDLFNSFNSHSFVDEFVMGYSKKVWGKDCKEVVGNIKDRFKFKDGYSTNFFEGHETFMPKDGYTEMCKNLAKGINIRFKMKDSIDSLAYDLKKYDKVFSSAPIDEFFNYKFGKLDYKKTKFSFEYIKTNGSKLLLTPVVNTNAHPEVIRLTEYNQFYHNNSHIRTIGIETSDQQLGTPCYPVMTKKNLDLLAKYNDYAKKYKNLHFFGRLGSYKYLDVDTALQNALDLGKRIK